MEGHNIKIHEKNHWANMVNPFSSLRQLWAEDMGINEHKILNTLNSGQSLSRAQVSEVALKLC